MNGITLACKLCLLGTGRVCKTSLRKTYLGENFNKSYTMTIGADFAATSLVVPDSGDKITANIWDLSGQEKFKIMRETYYRGVSGAILVYDITRRTTLNDLNNWIKELIQNNDGAIVPCLVIGNKSDLREEFAQAITTEEGEEFVKKLSKKYGTSFTFIEASALTGENVREAFETLIMSLYEDFKKII